MSDAARLISFPRSMCTSFAWGNITLLPIIHHVDDIADERSSAKAHNRVLMECYSLCCDIGLKGCFKQKLNDINRPIRGSGKGKRKCVRGVMVLAGPKVKYTVMYQDS